MKQALSVGAILAGLGAVAGGGAIYWMLNRPQPPRDGVRSLPELGGRVEIIRDKWAIPHIFADYDDDLFFVQGWIHAQERLWQMDFFRRFTAGRLSEFAGEATLEIDRWTRLLGLRRSAEAAWPHADEQARRIAIAYSAGVNAVIDENLARNNWPLEFRLLGYRPERWTPIDSISVSRMLALGLSLNFEAELIRDGLLHLVGPERAEMLTPSYPGENPLIATGLAALRAEIPPGQGSNAWVVGPTRSISGAPLLANDPHQMLRLPSVWIENHLHGPTYQVAGVSVPGMPGVVIGHNAQIAWGITAGLADVQDLYIEERHPEDPTRFRWGELWLQAQQLEERITVRGRVQPEPITITITRHGPLISALLPNEQRDLALRWTIYEPDNTLGALLGLNRAQNWAEARTALGDHGAPQLNLAYADRGGNIGWLYFGRIPIRQNHRGLVPADGASGTEEWLGYIPLDELPQAYNPPSGFVAHANNKPVDDTYPHWLGIDFFPGYRARRIIELLQARAAHDLHSFALMQQDLHSYPAQRVARAVAALPFSAFEADLHEARALLVAWDGRMTTESIAATIAHTLLMQVRHLLISDKIGSWAGPMQGISPRLFLTGVPITAYSSIGWVMAQLEQPDSPWWQPATPLPPSTPPPPHPLVQALREATNQLQTNYGPDMRRWQWGQVNQLRLVHPLGAASPLLAAVFSRGPYPLAGDAFTLAPNIARANATHANGYTVGASWRFLADLSDWDLCRTALPGGQSGLPASAHYASALDEWRRGETHPLLWSRPAIEQAARHRLVLKPA